MTAPWEIHASIAANDGRTVLPVHARSQVQPDTRG